MRIPLKQVGAKPIIDHCKCISCVSGVKEVFDTIMGQEVYMIAIFFKVDME